MATLVYSDVDGADRSFALGIEPILVGRSAECAIRSQDPRVSRTHARFFVEHGALWVEDLGSSNGIYVGPQKVQRAPVPTGEIVLVGSLMIRLLPASGTLPPPIGLHGTLAQWLEMERRARSGLEEERDAFVKRVGELFDEIRTLREAQIAGVNEANALRDELDQLRRESAAEIEIARLESAKAREAKMLAETHVGLSTVEQLAESDMVIARLEKQLAAAKAAAAGSPSVGEARAAADQIAAAMARAEKAEKDLIAAQIRAQGAERNVADASVAGAKAETRASELEHELAQAAAQRAGLEAELATTKEMLVAFETRLGAGDAHLRAAEARAASLAIDHATLTQQVEAKRARIAELEHAASTATSTIDEVAARLELTHNEGAAAAAAAQAKQLDEAQARIAELDTRLRQSGGAEAEIVAARVTREHAHDTLADAEQRVVDATSRAEDAEKRASAADTMAKAMAKDVAEALRRAADADVKTRAVTRELDVVSKRVDAAETRAALVDEAHAKLAAVERSAAEREEAVAAKLAQAEQELAERGERIEHELDGKLQQAQRELAAERQTALALVDRKTQLERELSDARARIADATAKASDLEAQLEQLDDRIQDLESGIAVEQTALASTIEETRTRVTQLEEQLVEAKVAEQIAVHAAAELEQRCAAMEATMNAARDAKASSEAALAVLRGRVAELEQDEQTHGGIREQAAAAEQRARDAELRLEQVQAKADAADLAIERASALQHRFDEALQKVSWLERDAASRQSELRSEQVRELESQLHEAEGRAQAAEEHVRDAETRAQHATQRASEVDARAREIEARAKDAAERIVDVERRARETQHQLAQVNARLEEADEQLARATESSGGNPGLERQLAAAQQRIAELVREVDAAENVRQFAAATEREIAQLERDLRDHKAKLAQLTLERDNLASQLDDLRENDETAHRRRPATAHDEPTANADVAAYSALVSRASELEGKYGKLEEEAVQLRRALAAAQARAEAQERAQEDEPTNTGNALPLEFAEHLNMLEESIDSLKANMRAASDETAMMEQTDSVLAVASAVSQAAEHVERARDAIRILGTLVERDGVR